MWPGRKKCQCFQVKHPKGSLHCLEKLILYKGAASILFFFFFLSLLGELVHGPYQSRRVGKSNRQSDYISAALQRNVPRSWTLSAWGDNAKTKSPDRLKMQESIQVV